MFRRSSQGRWMDFGVVEVRKLDTVEPSKDIIARDSAGKKTDIAEAGNFGAAVSSSSLNLKPVECGSTISEIPLCILQERGHGVIFVVENASLLLAKVKKSYQIINPDERAVVMKKHNLNRIHCRPGIIHEVQVGVRFESYHRLFKPCHDPPSSWFAQNR